MNDIYGNPVKDLDSAIIVSAKEAARLQQRAKDLDLKCACPACNPPRGDNHETR